MKNYYFYHKQNDLTLDNKLLKSLDNSIINIIETQKKQHLYKTIFFNKINQDLENNLTKQLSFFFNKLNLYKNSHIFIVGLGSDYHTPDSVGPNVLKHLKVNAYLENLGIKLQKPKVSSLKPGVLGETGILSEKTISSITKEIKPDVVILIDSFICNDVKYLNKTIEINDYGLSPGIGIKKINSVINKATLHIPVLVIGVPTAILITFKNNYNQNNKPYLLSTKDIDEYVIKIAELIGHSINKAIDSLS